MSNGAPKQPYNVVPRSYKHGSIIYFEGDRSDVIYILKAGKVVLTSRKIDSGEEVKEFIKLGEFFGVKSAIGRYPREETAQTVGDTTVLVVSRADFEKMIVKNVAMVTKMLRVFSTQLRKIGKMVRETLGEGDSINPADELFKIGEYYFKNGGTQQALHSYKKYLEHYPGNKYSEMAMKRIKAIETGATDEMDTEPVSTPSARAGVDLSDFSIEKDEDSGMPPAKTAPVSNEIDDFFSDNDLPGDLSLEDDSGSSNDITEVFYKGVSLFSQNNFNEALNMFNKVLEMKTLKNDSERKIFEKAHFEQGRCYLKLGKLNETINALSNMIKKFPNSDQNRNAFLHIGLAFETAKKPDKAIPYYKKVASMEPKDSVTKTAMKQLSGLQK